MRPLGGGSVMAQPSLFPIKRGISKGIVAAPVEAGAGTWLHHALRGGAHHDGGAPATPVGRTAGLEQPPRSETHFFGFLDQEGGGGRGKRSQFSGSTAQTTLLGRFEGRSVRDPSSPLRGLCDVLMGVVK
jgi:hypothetical protein